MATNCCGQRLSDLLQEQQEPFLVRRSVSVACGRRRRLGGGSVSVSGSNGGTTGKSMLLCGAKAVSKALLWDLAGCFSACGARDTFRRLPRDAASPEFSHGDKQHSPVSVLQPPSEEEESTELSHWDTGDEDDSKPSTSASASSPSSVHDISTTTLYSRNGDTVRAMQGEDSSKFHQTTKREQDIVSAWEKIAADISRVPRLVELDLSGSAREWRRRIGEEEARRVGESVEAMIFEEVRWEAVRDIRSAGFGTSCS